MGFDKDTKETVLVVDAASKCSIPIVESCAAMGLRVVAISEKKHCCGFFSRATRERIVCPPQRKSPDACLKFLLDFVRQRRISVLFPLGHFMTEFIAKHQDEFCKYTNLVLPPYNIFVNGLNKISTLKTALRAGCPIPQSWYPRETSLEQIVAEVDFPVLIKPAVSVGARGITYCYSAEELAEKLPKVEQHFGDCFVQEFIPQTGTQYKCAIIVDASQELLAGIVYAKLRYYPPDGGSSTLNKTVLRPQLLDFALKVAKELKWIGTCDFDFITDPRDDVIKLMEINPRFSDTYKMTAVAGQDMTKIIYQLAKGQKPLSQLYYQENRYMRFLFGDIMWFLKAKGQRFKSKPSFFNFCRSDTSYLMTGTNDLRPMLGYLLENFSMLWDRQSREFRLRRHSV